MTSSIEGSNFDPATQCGAPRRAAPFSYTPCGKPAAWSITLAYRIPVHEAACGRLHLAMQVESIARYGLCDFTVKATSPASFGPQAG